MTAPRSFASTLRSAGRALHPRRASWTTRVAMASKPMWRSTVILPLLGAIAVVVWAAAQTHRPGAERIQISPSPLLGSATAEFGIVVLSDFDCEKCTVFANDAWTKVRARYIDSGLASAVFRHLPQRGSSSLDGWYGECLARQTEVWAVFEGLLRPPDQDRAFSRKAQRPMNQEPSPGNLTGCQAARGPASEGPGRALAKRFGVNEPPAILAGRWVGKGLLEVRAVLAGPVPTSAVARAFSAIGLG